MSEQKPAASRGSWLIQWATLLAGVSLVLVVVNIALALMDQTAQAEVNQRQQEIAQAAQLGALTTVLTRALTTQEQNSKDPQIEDLLRRVSNALSSEGIPPASAAAPAAAKP
jgi:succinate dehydrogenase hydrophobic anchor subunit